MTLDHTCDKCYHSWHSHVGYEPCPACGSSDITTGPTDPEDRYSTPIGADEPFIDPEFDEFGAETTVLGVLAALALLT